MSSLLVIIYMVVAFTINVLAGKFLSFAAEESPQLFLSQPQSNEGWLASRLERGRDSRPAALGFRCLN